MGSHAELSSLLRRHGIRPRRSWSQNFLVDEAAIAAIAAAARPADLPVMELGAGPGVLTRELARLARRVIAVERDRRLARLLRAEFAAEPRVQVEEANAARLDYADWRRRLGSKPVVVGNLPYHMAAPILFALLEQVRELRRFVLMFQREMAERILAGAGERRRGVLGLLAQNRARVEEVLRLPPASFFPPPRVHSSVLLFEPRARPLVPEHLAADFARVVKAAFGQRRKMLRNALKGLAGGPGLERLDGALERAGIDGRRRPESLDHDEFARLAEELFRSREDDSQ